MAEESRFISARISSSFMGFSLLRAVCPWFWVVPMTICLRAIVLTRISYCSEIRSLIVLPFSVMFLTLRPQIASSAACLECRPLKAIPRMMEAAEI